MKRIIFIFCILPIGAFAQDRDLFNLSYRSTNVKTSDSSRNVKRLEGYFNIPVLHNEQQTIIVNLNFRQLWLNDFNGDFPAEVYGTSAGIIYDRKLNAAHELRILLLGGAYGDFLHLSSNDFRWTAGAEYITKYANGLKFGYGVSYTRQFYGRQINPLIELDKQLSDRWKISGLFPLNPKLEYKINGKSKTGFELNVDVNTFRLSGSDNGGQYLKTSQLNTLIFYQYSVFKNWNLFVKGGVSAKQQYAIYNQENSSEWTLLNIPLGIKPQPVENLQKSALSGQVGIAYSIF